MQHNTRSSLHIPFTILETEQSVAKRFEHISGTFSSKIAIKGNRESLTYGSLNEKANCIAHKILDIADDSESLVAIYMDQGTEFIASILATLKSGRGYIPLDPSFPQDRVSFIIQDTAAKVLLTTRTNLREVESLVGVKCQIICIDTPNQKENNQNLNLAISPDRLAYVMYTSGSTGKPKGVFQTQKNLLHNCMNNTNDYLISSKDKISLLYSCSVLGAVRAIFQTLLNGATLLTFDVRKHGLIGLKNWLLEEEITIYHSVTTLFRHLIHELPSELVFPKVRLIILGGEAVSRRDFELYQQHFSDECKLATGLGATETGTVCVNIFNKNSDIKHYLLPPGYPVDGMEVMIFDEGGLPLNTGDEGEIVVRSNYLAEGYWNRPDLTQKSFFDSRDDSGQRCYRTGDLGKLEQDGCLVHLGRKDFQVKVRGYRIELSEIEVTILDSGLVKETVVTGCQDEEGEAYLTAYYVVKEGCSANTRMLRDWLAIKLPSYMIPTYFVELNTIPLTANGKINRLNLPKPDPSNSLVADPAYTAPRNLIEIKLAKIWEEVLKVEGVGIQHNFIEIGGNSLLAAQVLGRIQEELQLNLLPKVLFESLTIAELASAIASHKLIEEEKMLEVLLEEVDSLSEEEALNLLSNN